MAGNVLLWPEIAKHLTQRLSSLDQQLRRAQGDLAAELRGRAQEIEELLNLPERLKLLADQEA